MGVTTPTFCTATQKWPRKFVNNIGDVNRANLIKYFGLHGRNVERFRIEELLKD